jgi:Caspase domain
MTSQGEAMSGFPDPGRAHALIIGTSSYQDEDDAYPDVPSAAASASKIYDLICQGDIWGLPGQDIQLPAENVQLLTGHVTVREAACAIEEKAAVRNLSALLVYICGHGQLWTDDDVLDKSVHFAFSDSRRSWRFSHLPFQDVRMMLQKAPRTAEKLLIIDCCYAKNAHLGGEEQTEPLDVPGVCTIVSTKDKVPALATWPGTDYTAFSAALIEVIEQGIPGPEPYLAPEAVYRAIWKRLTEARMPEPGMQVNGAKMLLCRNKHYQPAPDQSSNLKLHKELGEPREINLATYAQAVADRHATGRPGDAAQLVEEFCAKRTVTESVELAALLRSTDLGDVADRVIRMVYLHRAGAEIANLVHLLHQQGGIDIGEVLKALARRPAEVVTDLRAELRAERCDACLPVEGEINERLLGAWPPERLDELLAALH